jgi:FKBP-type peptidyl-prolyl cis-trans isomerase 2
MTMVKKQDFIEIDYTARIKDDNQVFDTTQEQIAKDNGLGEKNAEYKPVVICVGESHILKGVEEHLVGKEIGKEYTIELAPENAFGKKDTKLIQMVPTSKFRQQKIQPVPGLQLNIDGVFGIIKTVSGGRCMVDFNHPLSGKDLVYTVKLNKLVEEDKSKLAALLNMNLHMDDAEVGITEGVATVKSKKDIQKPYLDEFKKLVSRVIPSIKDVKLEKVN